MAVYRSEDGAAFSDDEVSTQYLFTVYLINANIFAQVITFLFAGHDTARNGVCWVLYFLSLYPEEYKKLQEEVDTVLPGEAVPTWEVLPSLRRCKNAVQVCNCVG